MPFATAPLWLGLARAAHAGPLVVHEGDPAAALAAVADVTGQSASEFQAISLAQILDGKLPTLTAGTVERCVTGPVPAADVDKHLAAADESISAKDYEFALGPAKAAEKAALCADAPIAAAKLARVAFATGVAAHANGDLEAAKVAFRLAMALEPATDWLTAAPESMKADMRIAAEIAARRDAVLTLVPADGASLDGRPASPENPLAPGQHWVDHAGTWMRVTLQGPATLVVPAAIAPGSVAWAADPAHEAELTRLLDALSPGVGYVVAGGEVYGRDATGGWEEIRAPKRKFEAGYVVAPLGGAMAAGGAVLAFTALGAGTDAVDTARTPGVTQPEFDAARSEYDGAKTRLIVGDVLIVSGVVLAGVGSGMLLDGASIGPIFYRGGGGGLGVSVGGAR